MINNFLRTSLTVSVWIFRVISFDVWYSVTIEQKENSTSGQYINRMTVNTDGDKDIGEIFSEVNEDPKIFKNVRLYAANKWHEPFTSDFGVVKNLLAREEYTSMGKDWRIVG